MLINELFSEADGFCPFYISDQWQVSQLNYCREQDVESICDLEVHADTDEIFILIRGRALILACSDSKETDLQYLELDIGRVYVVPQNVYHNIAMEQGTEVIIIEKPNTHKNIRNAITINNQHIHELREKWRFV